MPLIYDKHIPLPAMSRESIQRNDKAAPAELLTRSRAEIAKILDRILRRKLQLTAYLDDGEQLIVTRLRRVDPVEDYILVDYGQSRPANRLLLERKAVLFHCESGRQHIQFSASLPREAVDGKDAAVRLGFPEYLMQHQHRRHPRFRIPPDLRLKCVVECPGVISFDMDVQDISSGGVGMVTHDAGVKLEPGTVLPGCWIKHPLHRPICVDLEIRHSTVVQLPDGASKVRTGCRFVGGAADIAELIGMFSLDLNESS